MSEEFHIEVDTFKTCLKNVKAKKKKQDEERKTEVKKPYDEDNSGRIAANWFRD